MPQHAWQHPQAASHAPGQAAGPHPTHGRHGALRRTPDSAALTAPEALLALQRHAGNAAVVRALTGHSTAPAGALTVQRTTNQDEQPAAGPSEQPEPFGELYNEIMEMLEKFGQFEESTPAESSRLPPPLDLDTGADTGAVAPLRPRRPSRSPTGEIAPATATETAPAITAETAPAITAETASATTAGPPSVHAAPPQRAVPRWLSSAFWDGDIPKMFGALGASLGPALQTAGYTTVSNPVFYSGTGLSGLGGVGDAMSEYVKWRDSGKINWPKVAGGTMAAIGAALSAAGAATGVPGVRYTGWGVQMSGLLAKMMGEGKKWENVTLEEIMAWWRATDPQARADLERVTVEPTAQPT